MIELFNLIFIESPKGLAIIFMVAIVALVLISWRADMRDTFSKRYDQDKKWREDRD
jgi:hypothetical protein